MDVPAVRRGHRWKLVDNAVSVRMSGWVGERLDKPLAFDAPTDRKLTAGEPWPAAAWAERRTAYRVGVS